MEKPSTLVIITAYNRQQSLIFLLAELHDQDCDVVVFDDKSSDWDPTVCNLDKVKVIVNPEHRGKAGFWRTYNDIFAYCKEHEYDYYIIIPDDVEPCPEFIKEAIACYQNAQYPICLSPLLTNRSLAPGISRWGRMGIQKHNGYYTTHYFDCCGIMRRDFFEALDWHLEEIAPNPNPLRSSGVGRQITMRLQEQGKRMCHVERTLLALSDIESQMNPEERKRTPMYADWRNNVGCVDIHMASLWRDGHLLKTLESLLKQPETNTIFVTLNSYTDEQYKTVRAGIRQLLANYAGRIVTHRANNQKGSNEKLSQLTKSTAPYIAFADDDIIYPQDYLLRLIQGCNIHHAAVSFHGAQLKRFPIRKYYGGDRKMLSWNIALEEDTRCDLIGTGMGLMKREWFSQKELADLYKNAPATSMDDLIVSCALAQKGIARYVLAHPFRLVVLKQPVATDNYVYDRYKDNDHEQIAYLNDHYPAEKVVGVPKVNPKRKLRFL